MAGQVKHTRIFRQIRPTGNWRKVVVCIAEEQKLRTAVDSEACGESWKMKESGGCGFGTLSESAGAGGRRLEAGGGPSEEEGCGH